MSTYDIGYVIKRNGGQQPMDYGKIQKYIEKHITLDNQPRLRNVDLHDLCQGVIRGVANGMTTKQIETLAAEQAISKISRDPDYDALAARMLVTSMHKDTNHRSFSGTIAFINEKKPGLLQWLDMEKLRECDEIIEPERDYMLSYFSLKTLQRKYLLQDDDGVCFETPQHMWMRVALQVSNDDTLYRNYLLFSTLQLTHATPTLFHSLLKNNQMSSCYLLPMSDDSIEGIYNTLSETALISKNAGGIGISCSNIRATNAPIHSTNGKSNGLVPMLRVFDASSQYVDQGGQKRPGSIAVYIEPWHADIEDVIDLKLQHGSEGRRARQLFYAIWVPDIFMERVRDDGKWSLFCPTKAPELQDTWGEEFTARYKQLEEDGSKVTRSINARRLLMRIIDTQIKTGGPYMLYKDRCNALSNQQYLGCIRSSNLCAEIIEYTSAQDTSVCNLASVSLPKFIRDGAFNFLALEGAVRQLVRNLNFVIDRNYYPNDKTRVNNLKYRPIGIGIQGLADLFQRLSLPFDSDEAIALSTQITEHMYFAALTESMLESERSGRSYEGFDESPLGKGKFHWQMAKPDLQPSDQSDALQYVHWDIDSTVKFGDWLVLMDQIQKWGCRNSLLLAFMPTASTSQILGNNECFEPYTRQIYTRQVGAGTFTIVNKELVNCLKNNGHWNDDVRQSIIRNDGSVQHLHTELTQSQRDIFKTAYEIKQRRLIDMAAQRQWFIDQSQSLNLYVSEPSFGKMSTLHMYGWKQGLKTGMYYLHSSASSKPTQITVPVVCSRSAGPECDSCSG